MVIGFAFLEMHIYHNMNEYENKELGVIIIQINYVLQAYSLRVTVIERMIYSLNGYCTSLSEQYPWLARNPTVTRAAQNWRGLCPEYQL
jgi:hypothetical protein